MSTGASWTLSISEVGDVAVYHYNSGYRWAGGIELVGFGEGSWHFAVTPLAPGTLALSCQLTDENGVTTTFYLNTDGILSPPQPGSGPLHNPGMVLWAASPPYASDSIGSSQTLKLVNLGGGNIAL